MQIRSPNYHKQLKFNFFFIKIKVLFVKNEWVLEGLPRNIGFARKELIKGFDTLLGV